LGHIDLDALGFVLPWRDRRATKGGGVFAAGAVPDRIYRLGVPAGATGCLAALAADKYRALIAAAQPAVRAAAAGGD
jgi:thioredoxin reductase (NADPH)